VKLTARAESTISEGSPKTAAPFGAFIFTEGAPELAGVDDQSQPNRIAIAIASYHHHPLSSQGERIDSPHPASSRYRRWKWEIKWSVPWFDYDKSLTWWGLNLNLG
jgi:hypothetical protein